MDQRSEIGQLHKIKSFCSSDKDMKIRNLKNLHPKKFLLLGSLIFLFLLFLPPLAWESAMGQSMVIDRIVAVVNQDIITLSELQERALTLSGLIEIAVLNSSRADG